MCCAEGLPTYGFCNNISREVRNHKACLKSECTCRANIKYSMAYSEVVKGRMHTHLGKVLQPKFKEPSCLLPPYGRFSLTLLLHTVSHSQSAHASVFHFNYFSDDFFLSWNVFRYHTKWVVVVVTQCCWFLTAFFFHCVF